MIFHVGDIVELKPVTRNFSATTGAKAKVIKGNHHLPSGTECIIIEWIDNKRNEQCNGDYNIRDFILVNGEVRLEKVKVFGIVEFTQKYYK
jgi:hypothetical protein